MRRIECNLARSPNKTVCVHGRFIRAVDRSIRRDLLRLSRGSCGRVERPSCRQDSGASVDIESTGFLLENDTPGRHARGPAAGFFVASYR